MNIAIIGAEGFVGKACVHIFQNRANVIKIDPLLGNSVSDLRDQHIDVALICVPTPMGKDGTINASIVESVINDLSCHKETLVVLKSTVLPDIVERFAKVNKNFIYNPEFLTERNAKNDAEYPFMTVLGGEKEAVDRMEYIYKTKSICEPAPFYKMSAAEASFVKYGLNSFLALKVMFWNQMYDQIKNFGCDYDIVKQAVATDSRIGGSHMNVPGHDERKAFGNACFAKDIPALIQFSNKELTILKEAWNKNCEIRNSYGVPLPREIEQHIEFNRID